MKVYCHVSADLSKCFIFDLISRICYPLLPFFLRIQADLRVDILSKNYLSLILRWLVGVPGPL